MTPLVPHKYQAISSFADGCGSCEAQAHLHQRQQPGVLSCWHASCRPEAHLMHRSSFIMGVENGAAMYYGNEQGYISQIWRHQVNQSTALSSGQL
jgi:hypothetical protein